MHVAEYIDKLNSQLRTGRATEHTYRGYLQSLIESTAPNIHLTNEPKRSKFGAPDYVVTKYDIPIGYIEAKDLGADLSSDEYYEQFGRYKSAIDNLLITNYVDFELYREGDLIGQYSIGEFSGNEIIPIPDTYEVFKNYTLEFATTIAQTITSPSRLAKLMAQKAKSLAYIIENALKGDELSYQNTTLHDQYNSFKSYLLHDLSIKEFADMYAQTIVYGMFTARINDPTHETFTRQEAATLIPKSNPFLHKLFIELAGQNIDERIVWVVDVLTHIFRAAKLESFINDFGKGTHTNDPTAYFYETFIAEYNPKTRKDRGVWYTPKPIVTFIVKAVDDILKTEFGLKDGLADNSKTKIKYNSQLTDKRSSTGFKQIEREVHKVQILDPATGTGTFLSETIKQIHAKFQGMEGVWNNYVEKDLIPRLNGFEILMPSYAIAHMKLAMLLKSTGFEQQTDQRLRIYLTNSLEEHHPDTGTLFASWLSSEANEANHIKRDTPVMVVMGNPPYSVSSANKSKWIEQLTKEYKKDLNERNIQPLSDDYIKFIRFGHHLVEKNGEGVLAYVCNNSFLDGLIHRQMRKRLLETFDKIYVIDLHGNAKKKEVAPDGTIDENVFDIMQGVCVVLFVKTGKKKNNELGKVFRRDVYGSRNNKYEFLLTIKNPLKDIDEVIFSPKTFQYRQTTSNFTDSGFSVDEIFTEMSSGVQTKRDSLFSDIDSEALKERIATLFNINTSYDTTFIEMYNVKNSSSYDLQKKLQSNYFEPMLIRSYAYRPFDDRFIYYDKNLIGRPFFNIIKHLIEIKDNICLVITRTNRGLSQGYVFVTNKVVDLHMLDSSADAMFICPLYVTNNGQKTINMSSAILGEINSSLNSTNTTDPLKIFDYIYAVLHSLTYRKQYKELLRNNFPRIPYPKDADYFWKMSAKGSELRQLHLMELNPTTNTPTYSQTGNNEIRAVKYENGNVWINDTQYFGDVSPIAWNFYIGGYQPAQKWLKDRKGRKLTHEDIKHYRSIIAILVRTDELMKEIDEIYKQGNQEPSSEQAQQNQPVVQTFA